MSEASQSHGMFFRTEAQLMQRHSLKNSDDMEEKLEELWMSWDGHDPDPASRAEVTKHQLESPHFVYRQTPNINFFYDLGEVLGIPGQYGTVREAINKKTKEKRAVKIINKLVYPEGHIRKIFYEDLQFETYLMAHVKGHENIVEIFEVFEDLKFVYIVLEELEGGELYDYLQEHRPLTEKNAAEIFSQMMNAIYFLHSLNIVHCDIKPENFVFVSKQHKRLKCIDFGMSKIVRWRQYFKRMNGTPYYVSPEVLQGRYNNSCDVWSLGICLFILVFAVPPFFSTKKDKKEASKDVYRKIMKGFQPVQKSGHGPWFPKHIVSSSSGRDLISRMLRKNIADRITVDEALAHPWLQNQCTRDRGFIDTIALKSIVGYHKGPRLLTEILGVLEKIGFLNEHQKEEIEWSCKQIDVNGDGVIQMQELHEALTKFEPHLPYYITETVFKVADMNGNGVLEAEELLSARVYRKAISKVERLQKLFHIIDSDGDGIINAHEVQSVLETCSSARQSVEEQHRSIQFCRDLIAEVDINDNGKIDYEEFLEMFGVRTQRKLTWSFSEIIERAEHEKAEQEAVQLNAMDTTCEE